MSDTNGDAPAPQAPQSPPVPRGRVTVDGLSRRVFDHANVLGAVVACVDAQGQVHMHCSIDGAPLRELTDMLLERYYFGPMREILARARAQAAASGIVVPSGVVPNGKVIGG